MDVREVYFNHRSFDGCNGISYGYRGVGVPTWIENYPIKFKTHRMQVIDEFPFYIRLAVLNGRIRKVCTQLLKVVFECDITVNLRFANPKQVEVRAVENEVAFTRV